MTLLYLGATKPHHGLLKITLFKLFLFFIEDQIASLFTLFIIVRQTLAHYKITYVLKIKYKLYFIWLLTLIGLELLYYSQKGIQQLIK